MTLTATAKKLGVSIYHYIQDRVSGAFELPNLATQSRNAPPNDLWAHPGTRHNWFPRIIEKIRQNQMIPGSCVFRCSKCSFDAHRE